MTDESAQPIGARCGVHIDHAAVAACSRCGTFACAACIRHGEQNEILCAACGPTHDDRIPWEDRSTLGVKRAFIDTLVMSAREPAKFFGLLPRDQSVWPALFYGFIFAFVAEVPTFIYSYFYGQEDLQETLSTIKDKFSGDIPPRMFAIFGTLIKGSAVMQLLTSPIAYLWDLHVITFLTWLGLRVTGTLKTSYARLLKLFAYASWLQVLGLLTFSGDMIAGIFVFFVTLCLGSYYWLVIVKESQHISTNQAVAVSLMGSLLLVVAMCILCVPLSGLVIWGLQGAASNVALPDFGPGP